MNHTNLFKDQGLTFKKTFFSSINSRDSHSPVPRLNLSKLKYKDKKTDMNAYAEKLEESIKLLRGKIKAQDKEFDKLRHKYVKMASQNKKLFELNEKLKKALRASKENSKSVGPVKEKRGREKPSGEKCTTCGVYKNQPNNINIRASNSSFKIKFENE